MATIFTPAVALNTNDANVNTNFRTFVQLSAKSNGQLRITFRASTTTDLGLVGASFGKWDGNTLSATGGDMTIPAFRLTFTGSNTATVPAGTALASDFILHTGLTLNAGDWIIVAWFNQAAAGERFSTGGNTATTMFLTMNTDFSQAQTVLSTGQSWNIVGSIQPGTAGGTDYIVDQAETNDSAASFAFVESEW